MAVLEKRTNLGMKRKRTIKNPHKEFHAPPVPHRTKITPKNKRAISIAKPTRERLKRFKNNRALESYDHAIHFCLDQIHQLEKLCVVLKQINDLAVERDNVKFLIYGLHKKMPLELDITFREVIQRYRDE